MKGSSRKYTVLNWFSILTVVFVAAILIIAILALVWPYKTCVLTNLRVVDVSGRQGEGGLLALTFDYSKYTDLPAAYSISVVDGVFYDVETGTINSPPGCFGTKKIVKWGAEIPAGKYHVRVTLIYKVNPIRNVTRVFQTENTFEVVE